MSFTKGIENTIRAEAHSLGIPAAVLLALAEKESAGTFFWTINGVQVPVFRMEGHWFYKLLSGKERDRAVREGLAAKASKGSTAVKVPAKSDSRYAQLQRMLAINPEITYQSISMGFGQIMGFHYKKLGYNTAAAMWKDAQTVAGQVEQFVEFLQLTPALMDAVIAKDFKTIARLYNGADYARNNYDTDLARLTRKWEGKVAYGGTVPVSGAADPVGDTYVNKIVAMGYKTVREFQQANDLHVDGIVGKLTIERIEATEARVLAEKQRPADTAKQGVAVAGGLAAVTGIVPILDTFTTVSVAAQPVIDTVSHYADYGLVPLSIGAALIAGVFGFLYFKRKAKADVVA